MTKLAPATIGLVAVLVIVAFPLWRYCLHYFPYEDDFSLIRYSAVQESPAPMTWITKGFSDYFSNDPECATRYFGFDRPVANATFYLESLLYRSAEGPLLLMTNFLCWIISAWFVYGIACRLGTSRWIASCGTILYAMSPCWYRILIHASFRNNGLAACFILAASYVLLKPEAVRSWTRLVLAGILLALAAGSHEQGFTSLPVFAVGIVWLSFKANGKWRMGRIALAVGTVSAPSVLLLACFRLLNPMYGSSYVTSGFLGSLTESKRLTALGIHNSLMIGAVKLSVRVASALISAMSALTPLGTENMADLNRHAVSIVFLFALIASGAIIKRSPAQVIPLGALILYAVGRSIGIPTAEPRFMLMEVAWGVIALACALSASITLGNRFAVAMGTVAALGLLAFNIFSYNASILMRYPMLQRRNEVDRAAFYRLQAAAAQSPTAQVILVNDHAGVESARAMLVLAGFKNENFTILPSIMNSPSTDGLRNVTACPADTQLQRLPVNLQIRLDYPTGCAVSFFGRDMTCIVAQYRLAGLAHSAAWATYVQDPEKQGLYPSPLIDDVPIRPGKPLVFIVWRDRLSIPVVTNMPNENRIPRDWQAMR